MSLFTWKRSKPKAETAEAPPILRGDHRLSLVFLFRALPPLNQRALQERIEAIEPVRERLQVLDTAKIDRAALARITYDGHSLRLVGYDSPAPIESIYEAIECARWDDEVKQPLHGHRSHVLCHYEGESDDPAEQMLACWKLAGAFLDDGLLGIVDRDAWTCTPAGPLRQLLAPVQLARLRAEPPLGVWTGVAKLLKDDDEVWFCSKGFHRWGVVDFAWLGRPSEEEEAFALFNGLFKLARAAGGALEPGHAARLGEAHLRLTAVTEYPDFLEGPLGTRVVERLRAH